jgi:hypothetical protein
MCLKRQLMPAENDENCFGTLLAGELRPLQNSSIRHSGLDPESRKLLIILDTGLRRYDIIAGFMQFCKGLKAACYAR